MSEYRPIKTEIWDGEWFSSLSDGEKVIWFFLLVNKFLHISGIYPLKKPLVSPYTGVKDAEAILDKFEKDGKIIYRGGYIFIVNYLENQATQFNKLDNVTKSILRLFSENPKVIELFGLRDREAYKPLLRLFDAADKSLLGPSLKRERVKGKDERGKIKEENSESGKVERSIDWLRNIPQDAISKIMQKFHVSERIVRARAEDVIDYCEAKGKKYSNYEAALRTFVKKYVTDHPNEVERQTTQTQPAGAPPIDTPVQTEEERLAGIAKLQEMRDDLARKKGMNVRTPN